MSGGRGSKMYSLFCFTGNKFEFPVSQTLRFRILNFLIFYKNFEFIEIEIEIISKHLLLYLYTMI